MIHVAILAPNHLRAILSGIKGIESRLTRTRREPFEQVRRGERLYFKASGGAFGATAIAGRVLSLSDLTRSDLDELKAEHNHLIRGSGDYWRAKRDARYATLIWLTKVEPIDVGPGFRQHPTWASGRAWYTLPDDWCVYGAARRAA